MKLKLSLSLLLLLIFGSAIFYSHFKPVRSVPPSSLKDVLSTSQLSYFAILSAGNTAGDSVIIVNSNGPSKTTSNLFTGDTLAIGISASQHFYTVKGIGNTATIQLNTGTSASDVVANAVAIATRSAVHTISFQPNSTYTGGKWEFLIKVTSTTGEKYNDGIPDMNGFDVGGTNALTATDVTCPAAWSGVAAVGTTVVVGSNYYQSVTCTTPTGNSVGGGTTATIVIGSTNKLINPTPNHTVANEGFADVYSFFVRHYDGSSVLIDADTSQGKIAVLESVRVTATVDPTITFFVDSSGIGTTGCGITLHSNQSLVTATAVPFGSLSLGSTAHTQAQRLGVVTNGAGYVVTGYEIAAMTNLDGTGTTIPNTDCNTSACNIGTTGAWDFADTVKSEFGYSLQAISLGATGPVMAFTYGVGSSFYSKPFGVGSANAATLFSYSSTPISYHYVAVCYRVTAHNFQRAGDYENQIVYTATATF